MKPKVAFFDFAGCEGDQLQVANLEEELLDLLGQVDVVTFREVMKEQSDDYDIAFVEGSCTRLQDEDRLKKIRKNAKYVVAIGSCATIGGINSLKNYQDMDEVRRIVYGDKARLFDTYAARPIDAVIPVDAYVLNARRTRMFAHLKEVNSAWAPSPGLAATVVASMKEPYAGVAAAWLTTQTKTLKKKF
jgi:coenzyme F420-reducing hydrogenase gamma subunit